MEGPLGGEKVKVNDLIDPGGSREMASSSNIASHCLRMQRLCLRIYGLLARDIQRHAKALSQAAEGNLRKKHRQDMATALAEELPVFIALYALDKISDDERLQEPGSGELVRGMLLSCFSLAYSHLYDEPSDPLKHVMARVDWYLDGNKGLPQTAFYQWINMLSGERVTDSGAIFKYLSSTLYPELDRKLQLAFRYEFQGV